MQPEAEAILSSAVKVVTATATGTWVPCASSDLSTDPPCLLPAAGAMGGVRAVRTVRTVRSVRTMLSNRLAGVRPLEKEWVLISVRGRRGASLVDIGCCSIREQ